MPLRNANAVSSPEFATGAYIDPAIRKFNGLLPGAFDARDSILARLSHGEMVLNPRQIQTVIARAGFDAFAGVVPNYKTSNPKPQTNFASGGVAIAPVSSEPIHIHIETRLTRAAL